MSGTKQHHARRMTQPARSREEQRLDTDPAVDAEHQRLREQNRVRAQKAAQLKSTVKDTPTRSGRAPPRAAVDVPSPGPSARIARKPPGERAAPRASGTARRSARRRRRSDAARTNRVYIPRKPGSRTPRKATRAKASGVEDDAVHHEKDENRDGRSDGDLEGGAARARDDGHGGRRESLIFGAADGERREHEGEAKTPVVARATAWLSATVSPRTGGGRRGSW